MKHHKEDANTGARNVPAPELTDADRADRERWAKVKQIVTNVQHELRERAGYPTAEEATKLGTALAQLGAMLVDVGAGRERNARSSAEKKVRKALGFTYP